MSIRDWLRQPARRAELPAYLLLGVAALWSVFRFSRSMQILFATSHDSFMYYALWYVLSFRDFADVALRQSLYLPHTWFVLTPIFAMGWPVARFLLLGGNIAAGFYVGWRLATLAGLEGVKRWLLIALFWSWLSTGLVVGLGNLALVCLAAAVSAFPFDSPGKSVFLALSAMKQSLVFPLYFHLLLRRPMALIIPTAVFATCGIAVLLWARLGVSGGIGILQAWFSNVSGWTAIDHTCLRRLLLPFTGEGRLLAVLNWTIWFSLFAVVWRYIRKPLPQFAALMLLSLLPMYHHLYDMVAAAPALAVLFQRGSLAWPAGLTLALATNPISPIAARLPEGSLRAVVSYFDRGYYPLIILVLLGVLVWQEVKSRRAPEEAVLEDRNSKGDKRVHTDRLAG